MINRLLCVASRWTIINLLISCTYMCSDCLLLSIYIQQEYKLGKWRNTKPYFTLQKTFYWFGGLDWRWRQSVSKWGFTHRKWNRWR